MKLAHYLLYLIIWHSSLRMCRFVKNTPRTISNTSRHQGILLSLSDVLLWSLSTQQQLTAATAAAASTVPRPTKNSMRRSGIRICVILGPPLTRNLIPRTEPKTLTCQLIELVGWIQLVRDGDNIFPILRPTFVCNSKLQESKRLVYQFIINHDRFRVLNCSPAVQQEVWNFFLKALKHFF